METYKYIKLAFQIPEPLCCLASVYLPQFNSVYIHGGYGDTENKSIYCMNLETLDWRSKSSTPESLVGHAAVEIEGRMFIFGGWNEKEYTSASLLYDPIDNSMIKCSPDHAATEFEYPSGRRDHTLTHAGDNIYLLGGWDSWKWSNANSSFSQLWKLVGSWTWELCEVFGENPSTRRGHSTIYFKELEELVVFGGIYGLNSLLGDLYVLSLHEMHWNKLNIEGGPSKRAWHCASNYGNFMYVFGGLIDSKNCSSELFRFDLVNKNWECMFLDNGPSPRCGGNMLQIEGFLMILGGRTQNEEASSEVFILDIEENYQKFRENAKMYGEVYHATAGIEPPPIPEDLRVSRRYSRKSSFNPLTFKTSS